MAPPGCCAKRTPTKHSFYTWSYSHHSLLGATLVSLKREMLLVNDSTAKSCPTVSASTKYGSISRVYIGLRVASSWEAFPCLDTVVPSRYQLSFRRRNTVEKLFQILPCPPRSHSVSHYSVRWRPQQRPSVKAASTGLARGHRLML